jgi:hypothetical protein
MYWMYKCSSHVGRDGSSSTQKVGSDGGSYVVLSTLWFVHLLLELFGSGYFFCDANTNDAEDGRGSATKVETWTWCFHCLYDITKHKNWFNLHDHVALWSIVLYLLANVENKMCWFYKGMILSLDYVTERKPHESVFIKRWIKSYQWFCRRHVGNYFWIKITKAHWKRTWGAVAISHHVSDVSRTFRSREQNVGVLWWWENFRGSEKNTWPNHARKRSSVSATWWHSRHPHLTHYPREYSHAMMRSFALPDLWAKRTPVASASLYRKLGTVSTGMLMKRVTRGRDNLELRPWCMTSNEPFLAFLGPMKGQV